MVNEELKENDPIPSERELQERFGVARMTVRRAIEQLVDEGRLYRVAGRGTFVTTRSATVELHLSSFSEDMAERGLEPTQTLLDLSEKAATPYVAKQLGIAPQAPVISLSRTRGAGDRLICLERCYLPSMLVPGLIDRWYGGSLYQVLDDVYGLRPTWAEQTIGAIAATANEAEALHVQQGAPLLRIRQVAYRDRRAVEYCTTWYRHDEYELWVTVGHGVPSAANGTRMVAAMPSPIADQS